MAGHVGNLVARDTVTVGTKYPHVLGLAGPGARVGSEGRVEGAPSIDVDGVDPSDVASSLVAFSIVAFDPMGRHAGRADYIVGVGEGSDLTVYILITRVAPLQAVPGITIGPT